MAAPYRIWEILQRSHTGPFCEEKDFMPKIFAPKLKEIVKKYAIKYDPQTPVPADNDLADRVWQAGWELFREVGLYNTDTNRIIKVAEDEIKEALYTAKGEYWVGAGKDAVLWKHRRVEDEAPPFCIFSPDITVNENLHHSMCLAYLKEPLLDGICAPILEEAAGQLIRSAGPTEISGCIQHIYNLRLAARQVGRPGVFLVAVGTAEHDSGQIAVSDNEWGVRTTDARLVGSLSEFMTADTLLNRVVHYAQYGCYTGNLTGPIYGGWCGGSEGIAVSLVAYTLSGLCIHGAHFSQHFPFHLHWGSNSTRELLWPIAVAGQAMARNSKLLYTSNGFANAGPMTEMLFYETACHALVSTVSGWHLWEMASTRNKYRNRATPMEARLGMEVGHAAARQGLTREQANALALKLLSRYEDQAADAPRGKEYQECYDVAQALPTQEHFDMYRQVKDELAALGIDFPY
ncbi:MAG: monomethylamine:corrinoid methyltransferase [Desulfobacterales bacterium]|nr:MAG: monomethylamine:corrinoid methyltransferase [Desulfobacterales bacterium]